MHITIREVSVTLPEGVGTDRFAWQSVEDNAREVLIAKFL